MLLIRCNGEVLERIRLFSSEIMNAVRIWSISLQRYNFISDCKLNICCFQSNRRTNPRFDFSTLANPHQWLKSLICFGKSFCNVHLMVVSARIQPDATSKIWSQWSAGRSLSIIFSKYRHCASWILMTNLHRTWPLRLPTPCSGGLKLGDFRVGVPT